MRHADTVIIGAGAAGLAAALKASELGIEKIILIERQKELGGILLQCIHSGFGLQFFGEEMTGPEFAGCLEKEVRSKPIEILTESYVTKIREDRILTVMTPEGEIRIHSLSVILASGANERTRGMIQVPGERPAGVWTAGTAQYYVNIMGQSIGKRIFILGSGDIGLIMARRLTLEGAQVLGVAEIANTPSGLARNIQQCLLDWDIPLFLSHTVTFVHGKGRVSGVTIQKLKDGVFEPGSEKFFSCDTLLISAGLLPNLDLLEGKVLTEGRRVYVNDGLETSLEGVFICGNALEVHDLVDNASAEGQKAAVSAWKFLNGEHFSTDLEVRAGGGLVFLLPQKASKERILELSFRVREHHQKAVLRLSSEQGLLKEFPRQDLRPQEMEHLKLEPEILKGAGAWIKLEVL